MKRMTWDKATRDFLEYLGAERRSDAYIQNVGYILRRFGESTGGKKPARVGRADVNAWLTDLNGRLAPSTVGGYLTILRSAMRYWQGDGETPVCVKGLKLAGVRESRVKGEEELLTEDEYHRLLSVMPPDKALFFRLLWDTGARAGEILNLCREDVSWIDGDAKLTFRQTKARKPRSVPVIAPSTVEMLRARRAAIPPGGYLFPSPRREGKPLGDVALWRYLNRVKERVGIKKRIYLHLFRHTARQRLLGLSGPIRAKMMGWIPGSKAEAMYGHLETENVRQALHEIEGTTESEEETAARTLVSLAARIAAKPGLEKALLELQELQAQILIRSPEFLEKAQEVSALLEDESDLAEMLGNPEGEVNWEAAKTAARRKD